MKEENKTHLGDHKFSGANLFKVVLENSKGKVKNPDASGKWKGYRREWAVFTYEELETEEWGLGEKEKARVTVCYKDDQVGLILRYMKPEGAATAVAVPTP